jgi:hypothetical protein
MGGRGDVSWVPHPPRMVIGYRRHSVCAVRLAEPALKNTAKLDSFWSLYSARLDCGLPVKEFAEEFFRAMGKILIETPMEHLDPTHGESERNSLNYDDPDQGYTFVPVVVSFDPKEGTF